MKAWLKGGIIVSLIIVVLDLVLYIVSNISLGFLSQISEMILFLQGMIMAVQLAIFRLENFQSNNLIFIAVIILSVVEFFILGAVIGWLIGKFKK